MFLQIIQNSKYIQQLPKKFLLASALTISFTNALSVAPQSKVDVNSKFSNTSFITKAVEKTGASVVTIDTQKYVKQKRFSKDSRIFIKRMTV